MGFTRKNYLIECAALLEGFPSGQRDQTVNLTAPPSLVRIQPPPPLFFEASRFSFSYLFKKTPVGGSDESQRFAAFETLHGAMWTAVGCPEGEYQDDTNQSSPLHHFSSRRAASVFIYSKILPLEELSLNPPNVQCAFTSKLASTNIKTHP